MDQVRLRKLNIDDSGYMLEWMQDINVSGLLDKDFSKYSLDDCIKWIREVPNKKYEKHFAITDSRDKYLGTVSLKNINNEKKTAEFAIAVRAIAMGKGISKFAMKRMLHYGFNDLGLDFIYWYVSPQNTRALRFYDKNGYKRTTLESIDICDINIDINREKEYIWYLEKRNQ